MSRPAVWPALANTGWFALVPPVVTGVVIPVGLVAANSGGVSLLSALYVEQAAKLLVPALAAWWPPFVFRERIEGDGRELLYFLKPRGEGALVLWLIGGYLVLTVPFVAASEASGLMTGQGAALLAARCAFMAALAFSGSFVLGSSALGLVLALAFNIVAMAPMEQGLQAVAAGSADLVVAACYVAVAVLLVGVGEWKSRRFSG